VKKRRSSKQADKTAMGHALEWCARRWPSSPEPEVARPDLRWIPNGQGGLRPMSAHHDFFGVFDIIVAPQGHGVVGIQVTSATPREDQQTGDTSLASKRRQKIEAWITEHYGDGPCPFECYVIAWVARRHFRVWRWQPAHYSVNGLLEERLVPGYWEELPPEPGRLKPRAAPLLEQAEELPF